MSYAGIKKFREDKVQERSIEYERSIKLLTEVRPAFYRKEDYVSSAFDEKYSYRLVTPGEGDDFTYYKHFREFMRTMLSILRWPEDRLYLMFKNTVMTITKTDDIKFGKYTITCVVNNERWATPEVTQGPHDTLSTAIFVEHILSDIFNL